MQCRQCGTEIADRALICYRCGAATAEAKFKPPVPARRRSSTTRIVVALIALILLALAVLYLT